MEPKDELEQALLPMNKPTYMQGIYVTDETTNVHTSYVTDERNANRPAKYFIDKDTNV